MPLSNQDLIAVLKAVAEPTRWRILMLLRDGELSVKDLTVILGQSQPRISRHLKLLAGAGVVDRFQEGSWAYFHLRDRGAAGQLLQTLLRSGHSEDPVLQRDQEKLSALIADREDAAQAYFLDHAEDWDRIRALHVAEAEVEAVVLSALGSGPFKQLVDLGTGTGRMLELFATCYDHGLGIDVNQAMLAYARSRIAAAGLSHAHVRHGDIYDLPLGDGVADAVVMHQVLHYLREPALAIKEGARLLRAGGRLLIVDFAPHKVEFLRDVHRHERLGLSDGQVRDWLKRAGLDTVSTRVLAPRADKEGSQKLTVSIWLAELGPDNEKASAGAGRKTIKEAV